MTCRDATAFLMEYLDGELSRESHRIFEQHLLQCPACRDYLASYQTTIALGKAACVDDAASNPPPRELVDAILASRKAATKVSQ